RDMLDNSFIASLPFTIDTTAPAIRILSPSDGWTTNEATVVVEWGTDDPASLVKVEVRVDDGPWTAHDGPSSAMTLTALSDGDHRVSVRGTFANGWTDTDGIIVRIDTVPPVVEAASPQGEVQQRPNVITATFSETVAHATIMLEDIEGEVSLDGASIVFVPSSELVRGKTYAVMVNATDLAGNMAISQWTFTIVEVPPAKGMVTDSVGRPVAGAVVALSDGQQAVTDGDGVFALDVEPGTYEVTVSRDGYQSVMTPLRLGPGEMAMVGLTPVERGPTTTMMLVVGLSMLALTLIALGLILPGRRG
ncbi:MAG TPA: carboxypeptidase regulatory-like domain-containing protein, partial [Methanomassiliicoccaceae archaeon]|nr:carboxypeptidase regulatory-like domain-containing protein [Methanomassiliicoccaceae archaeon]